MKDEHKDAGLTRKGDLEIEFKAEVGYDHMTVGEFSRLVDGEVTFNDVTIEEALQILEVYREGYIIKSFTWR